MDEVVFVTIGGDPDKISAEDRKEYEENKKIVRLIEKEHKIEEQFGNFLKATKQADATKIAKLIVEHPEEIFNIFSNGFNNGIQFYHYHRKVIEKLLKEAKKGEDK